MAERAWTPTYVGGARPKHERDAAQGHHSVFTTGHAESQFTQYLKYPYLFLHVFFALGGAGFPLAYAAHHILET